MVVAGSLLVMPRGFSFCPLLRFHGHAYIFPDRVGSNASRLICK